MLRRVPFLFAITNLELPDSWKAKANKELKGKVKLESLIRVSPEGIKVKPVYIPSDLVYHPPLPGEYPFTRGVHATMYNVKPWTIRQHVGFPTAEESNAFYKNALAMGQQGLSVAFDLATHRGYDSDHPRVVNDVGNSGVAIDSVEDMKVLFKDIPLDKVSVSLTMNGAVIPILAFFAVAAEETGVSQEKLTGTVENDILKEFLVRNTYIYPPEPSMRIIGDIMEYLSKNQPKFNSISISGYHMQEAGANAALEVAYTIADGIEYIRCAAKRGIPVDAVAPRFSFFFGIGMKFYMEIAKLRAARTVWAEQVKKYFDPKDPKSMLLRLHTQTSGWSLAERDMYNNAVRTAVEAMAGVFGGTQSMHTNALDEAVGLPSKNSSRIARNTQIIIREETGVPNVVDPWGGSYMMELLTQELIEAVTKIIDDVEAKGGMAKCIADGFPRQRIEEARVRKQALIDSGKEVIVGVNKYIAADADIGERRHFDNAAVLKAQAARLAEIRATRDNDKVQKLLDELTAATKDESKNLLQIAIEAARARCTLGEITSAMEKTYGRHVAKERVEREASADDIGIIKNLVEKFAAQQGRPPRILVAKMGQEGKDLDANNVAAAYTDLGFDIEISPLLQTPAEVAKHAVTTDVHVVAINNLAAGHKKIVPELVEELRKLGAPHVMIVVIGAIPREDTEELLKTGAKHVFGSGSALNATGGQIIQSLLDQYKQN